MSLIKRIRVRYGGVIAVVVAAGLLAAGAAPVAADATGSSPLLPFLPRPGEMSGFTPGGPKVFRTAAALVADFGKKPRQAELELGRYEAEGFVEATGVQMNSRSEAKATGIASVTEFETPAGAQAEMAAELKEDLDPRGLGRQETIIRHFRVPGVPKVAAWSFLPTGAARRAGDESAAANGLFVEGSCFLVVADVKQTGGEISGPVISGVQAIFRRSGGTCP